MKSFRIVSILLAACLCACSASDYGYDTDSDSSGDSSGGSGSSGDSSSGSYDYSFTCPGGYGREHTLPIPRGSCESEYKNYGETFGCNDVDNFNNAACSLESCAGGDFGCGDY